jgi:hypothetical protein
MEIAWANGSSTHLAPGSIGVEGEPRTLKARMTKDHPISLFASTSALERSGLTQILSGPTAWTCDLQPPGSASRRAGRRSRQEAGSTGQAACNRNCPSAISPPKRECLLDQRLRQHPPVYDVYTEHSPSRRHRKKTAGSLRGRPRSARIAPQGPNNLYT